MLSAVFASRSMSTGADCWNPVLGHMNESIASCCRKTMTEVQRRGRGSTLGALWGAERQLVWRFLELFPRERATDPQITQCLLVVTGWELLK
jgi:hypothetical protein